MALRGRRRNQKRYQVYVHMGTWSPMTRFDEISHALNWISQYDPEGTVRMMIKDHETGGFIALDEAYEMMPKKKAIEEEDDVDWKQEGF